MVAEDGKQSRGNLVYRKKAGPQEAELRDFENQSNGQDYGSAMQGTTVHFMETVTQEVERYEERVNNFYLRQFKFDGSI